MVVNSSGVSAEDSDWSISVPDPNDPQLGDFLNLSKTTAEENQVIKEYTPEEIQKLNDDVTWPKPKWLEKEKKSFLASLIENLLIKFKIKQAGVGHNYKDYFASHLRARYSQLVVDFRTIYPTYFDDKAKMRNVFPTSQILVQLLKSARESLERENLRRHDLLVISNLLDLAEQCMVWIYPENISRVKSSSLCTRLKEIDPANRDDLIKKFGDIEKISEKELYPLIEESTRACNKKDLEEKINTGLQIERLKALRSWGFVLLLVFCISFPQVTVIGKWPNYNNTTATDKDIINNSIIKIIEKLPNISTSNGFLGVVLHPWIAVIVSWTVALSIAVIGAIGGFLSGLLQIRSSKTSLALYEESVLLFHLRLIIGAFAALVSIMLLSWGVLSGIVGDKTSSYVLVAFFSGFSERYFLNLLNIKSDEEQITNSSVNNAEQSLAGKNSQLQEKG